MVDPTSHPDFDLDTALSAELDGELAAYVSELGLDVADVHATLAAPAAAARRAELAAARDSLRREPAAVPPLDDVTRRRLLAGAGVGTGRSPSHRDRDRGRFLRAAVAAAVTLLVLAGGYAIFHDSGGSGGSGAKSRSGGGGSAAVAVTGDLGDVGTIDPDAVAGFLEGRTSGASDTPAGSSGSAPSAESGAAADRSTKSSGTFAPASPRAIDDCAKQYAAEGSIRFRGLGIYQGRPAVVLGIDTAGRTIVFVVAADDCARVLYSASR